MEKVRKTISHAAPPGGDAVVDADVGGKGGASVRGICGGPFEIEMRVETFVTVCASGMNNGTAMPFADGARPF